MKMKKITALLIALTLTLGVLSISANAIFGTGYSLVAKNFAGTGGRIVYFAVGSGV